jgi:hypothetical protein
MEGIKRTNFATYKTTNYDLFKTLKGNRQLNELNVKSIVKSIEENGILPSIAIVNEKMEVIDGQHRIEAMKRTENPVYFQVREGYSLKDCIALNVASRNWTTMDYIDSYAEQGNPDYERLRNVMEKYSELPKDVIRTLCVRNSASSTDGGNTATKIKNGTYLCIGEDEAREKFDLLKKAAPYIEKSVSGRKSYVYITLANIAKLEKLDMGRAFEQLRKGYISGKPIATADDALDFWFDVYNYRKKTKVRFIDEYKEKFKK